MLLKDLRTLGGALARITKLLESKAFHVFLRTVFVAIILWLIFGGGFQWIFNIGYSLGELYR